MSHNSRKFNTNYLYVVEPNQTNPNWNRLHRTEDSVGSILTGRKTARNRIFQLKIVHLCGFFTHQTGGLPDGFESRVCFINPCRLVAPMAERCVLVHPGHPPSLLGVERGLTEGLTFFTEARELEHLRQRFSSEIIVYPKALQPRESLQGEACFLVVSGEAVEMEIHKDAQRVVLSTKESMAEQGTNTTNVIVHDMLPPLEHSTQDQLFASWRSHCIAGTTPTIESDQHHWCDRIDVAAVVAHMIKANAPPGRYDLAGRRSWTTEDTWGEFGQLMARTQAGQSGRFEQEHLKVAAVSSVSAVPVSEVEETRARPNLDAVHDFLMETTGEGWRPKTPLRHSLMFTIAGLEQRQGS